jgi:nucleoside-diphosphate-sugar epimerase
MLTGSKILVTGAAGQIGQPLAASLAQHNEVWGVARFTQEGSEERLESLGIHARRCDLAAGDLSSLPTDFDYLIHCAVFQGAGEDYDEAIRTNAEGTGLLLQHGRNAKAALVMSTHSVYRPQLDAAHVFSETDPLGDASPQHSPTYSISKIAEEAVARYCARAFRLPVTLARMNASYGPNGGLPMYHFEMVLAGQPVVARHEPAPYSPIHQDDINGQIGALLDAASIPATIVNWAGDEAVTVQEWCAYFGELTSLVPDVKVVPAPGTLLGSIADTSRRASFTGPCSVSWKDGMRRSIAARHPELTLAEA